MGLILSLETSTKVCSVALHRGDKLIAVTEYFEDQSHSRILIEQIHYLLDISGFKLSDLDAIAVSKGPGSYTGLRIGVATAKGLCYAVDKPLIAINTLESMVWGVNKVNPEKYGLCAMLDARRMEVYCCVMDASNTCLEPTNAKILSSHSFEELLCSRKILFFGNGSEKCRELLMHQENALFLNDIHPSAVNIGYLAEKHLTDSIFEDLAYFEPYYLKEFLTTIKK